MAEPFFVPNSDEFDELQHFVDALFASDKFVNNLDVQVKAEMYDLPVELVEIITMLPSGIYERSRLADQFNSSLAAHGWTRRFGTVE